jgi:phospholipid/cholesterol/gamma-HCH transport system substrate-binding protein
MRLTNAYKFPKDTSASILTSGLLGEQYVGLDAGGDTTNLKQGDEIKLTQSAVVLEKVIGQFLYGKASEGAGSK